MSETAKTKLLIVVKGMTKPGGIETYIVNVLSAIALKKFNISILYTELISSWYGSQLRHYGIQTIYCRNPYTQIGYVWRLYHIIKQNKFDIVCDFRNDFAAPTLLAAKLAGVKSRVAMYRSSNKGFKPDPIRNIYSTIMHKYTQKWATKIIGNTKKVLDAFYPQRDDDEKFAIVHNGVDIKKFQMNRNRKQVRMQFGIAEDTIVIGHVGRFHPAKNHKMLIKVFAGLKREIENIHLLLVGHGVLKEEIERNIRELDISNSVTLAVGRTDIPQLLSAMDIFCYTSIYEGLPNALLEAMASGLPIVASNIEEIKEIVPPKFNCQLYRVDDIEGFVKGLKELCLDLAKRENIGLTVRKWVEQNFSIGQSVNELCQHLLAGLSAEGRK